MDITTLRNMRNQDFGAITQAFEKVANPQSEQKSYTDDRIWKLVPDKAGNATATIRFLPRVEGDELPWVRIFKHSFQGPTGKWYIENSLTTFGEKDPVSELNNRLWNSGSEANKDVARKQKRRLSYLANILVVDDPKHPENNGKVFLFQFGKKIFDKIMDKARPTFEDEKPVNVFDLWEGADFKIRMRKVDGFANYDQSTFNEPTSLYGGDEERLLETVGKQYALSEFLDRDKYFKSFEDLSRKLSDVLGEGDPMPTAAEIADHSVMAAPAIPSKPAPTPTGSDTSGTDDDMMSYFQRIAEED
jgi:hypothetical protein